MQINSLIAASIDIYLRNTKYPLKEYELRLIATTVPVTLDRRYITNYQPAGHRDQETSFLALVPCIYIYIYGMPLLTPKIQPRDINFAFLLAIIYKYI
jgi:hypothetical protein